MEDATFRAVKGNYDGWYSESLMNANYDVKTTLKSGSLPPGISEYCVPNDRGSDYFGFDGTPTELGTFEVTYTITKLDGSDSIDVTFTFNVEEVSNEALLEALILTKDRNPSLPYDIEGVIDNVNDTIKFTVPYGTDITKLQPTPTYYKNSTLPSNLWNGSVVDFTNLVDYVVTAEDGVTKKTYTVSVEVLPSPDGITSIDIDNKITEIKVGSTHTFAATVNGFGSFDNSVTWKIEGATSKDTTINNNGTLTIGEDEASTSIKVIATASGEYRFTVVAEADGYASSDIAGEDTNTSDSEDNVNVYVNTKPEITVNNATVTVKVGTSFNEREGVTAYDKEEGDLTDSIEVISSNVNINLPGIYTVTYRVVDRCGLEDTKIISVIVVSNEKPVISGADNIQIEFGSEFDPRAGVTATDYEDKDLTPDNKVESGSNESNNGSNNEELPKTGAVVSTSQLSLLSSLFIFIGGLLTRRKRK